jgi:hypothetical protein
MLPIIRAASGSRVLLMLCSGIAAAACEIVNGTRAIVATDQARSGDQLWQRRP